MSETSAPPDASVRREPRGLSSREAAERLLRFGPNETPRHEVNASLLFLKKFWGLSAWMLELIAVLSWALHKKEDLWVAIGLLFVNAFLSFHQQRKAQASVEALRKRLSVKAKVLRDEKWMTLEARELVPEDVVRLRSGDFVPADVKLLDGDLSLDQSALTGESVAVARKRGETAYSGSIVQRGEATGQVEATGIKTYFGRTTELVDIARPRLHMEDVVANIVKWLFVIVGVLVAAAFGVALLRGYPALEILPLFLVVLSSAVPVALPVMFTVSMAIGATELSRKGVLVTRLSAAEDAAEMSVLCVDKTGTVTLNQLSVTGALPEPGVTETELLRAAFLASEEADRDPIDLAFIRRAREGGAVPSAFSRRSFTPFSPESRRTEATVEISGNVFTVAKGSLHSIAALCHVEGERLRALERTADEQARRGYRVLGVAEGRDRTEMRLLGLATLIDPPRPDSSELIQRLGSLGVGVKMLTGDALPVAGEVAKRIGLGSVAVASASPTGKEGRATELAALLVRHDGLAEVYPEDKYDVVRALQESGKIVGMTGDGVNDAPSLKQAEVGIAVRSATDVAKGAASVVLTEEGMGGIVDLVTNGRRIHRRILVWIVNKISRTIMKAGLVTVVFIATGRFVISAFAMLLLVFMTDFAKVALSTDRMTGSGRPETWKIGGWIGLGAVLGVIMLAESLLLLALCWRPFHLETVATKLHTFTFELLLLFALFSLLSIRERKRFYASRPSATLGSILALDAVLGACLAASGIGGMEPIPFRETFLILASVAFLVLVVNDSVKVFLVSRLEKPA